MFKILEIFNSSERRRGRRSTLNLNFEKKNVKGGYYCELVSCGLEISCGGLPKNKMT